MPRRSRCGHILKNTQHTIDVSYYLNCRSNKYLEKCWTIPINRLINISNNCFITMIRWPMKRGETRRRPTAGWPCCCWLMSWFRALFCASGRSRWCLPSRHWLHHLLHLSWRHLKWTRATSPSSVARAKTDKERFACLWIAGATARTNATIGSMNLDPAPVSITFLYILYISSHYIQCQIYTQI